MSYRDTATKLAQYRAEIAELRKKMRDAQSAIEPEEVKDYTFRSARGAMRLSDLFSDKGYWRDGPRPGVSVFKRRGGKILRVADTSFSSGDDFCIVWHFLNLIPEGGGAWQPKYNYGT